MDGRRTQSRSGSPVPASPLAMRGASRRSGCWNRTRAPGNMSACGEAGDVVGSADSVCRSGLSTSRWRSRRERMSRYRSPGLISEHHRCWPCSLPSRSIWLPTRFGGRAISVSRTVESRSWMRSRSASCGRRSSPMSRSCDQVRATPMCRMCGSIFHAVRGRVWPTSSRPSAADRIRATSRVGRSLRPRRSVYGRECSRSGHHRRDWGSPQRFGLICPIP